ncbi:hypothetical protein DPMN_042167 [Dreissena polymorpha]|uniref:Uncharacterized protein n=1 Tax=Dreissena polymorpha TaxID=45954 RepID=A0A9D4CYL2_DREPO|nr:hypothetical protein DPMN_042167 [Dreissena polymorpha]
MNLPSSGSSSSKNKYIPCGGKRLEALQTNSRSTLSKKRNNSNGKTDVERHSMELEEKFKIDEEGVFRMRSKTVGDLNEVSSDDFEDEGNVASSETHIVHNGGNSISASSENSSCSNLSTSSHYSGSSAKLTFASANPLKFISAKAETPPMGSPVWKPRNEANVAKQQQFRQSRLEMVKVNKKVTPELVLKNSEQECSLLKDTEC